MLDIIITNKSKQLLLQSQYIFNNIFAFVNNFDNKTFNEELTYINNLTLECKSFSWNTMQTHMRTIFRGVCLAVLLCENENIDTYFSVIRDITYKFVEQIIENRDIESLYKVSFRNKTV